MWKDASSRRRAGDIPEVSYIRSILRDPRAKGLTADHLIRGASAAEIDAILAARPPASVDACEDPEGGCLAELAAPRGEAA